MQRRYKGSVTIFMTCLLGIMTTFLYSLIKSAMYYSSDMNLSAAVHAAGISLLSEYNKDLFDNYSILLIDTSYKGKEPDNEKFLSHARLYLDKNTSSHNGGVAFGSLEIGDVTLKEKKGPLENNGEGLIMQLVHIEWDYEADYEAEYGLFESDYYKGESNLIDMDESLIETKCEGYFNEWDAYLEYIDSMNVSISNPAESLKDIRDTGVEYILDIGMIDDYSIDSVNVNDNNTNFRKDDALESSAGYSGEQKDLFCRYLIRNLSNATTDSLVNEESRYEAEYVIGGCNSARDNVERIAGKIVKWLFIRNYEYIWDNEDRTNEVIEEAKRITDYCEDSFLIEAVGNSLKCIWAYTEALLEVNALLEGSKISIEDPFETWLLPVEEIMSYTAYLGGTDNGDCGYDDFLFQMMRDESICDMNVRFADVLDTNIVSIGNKGYETGKCISSFELSVDAINNGKDVTKKSEIFEYRVY